MAFAPAKHHPGRLSKRRFARLVIALPLAMLSVWGLANSSAAEEAATPTPAVPEAKAEQADENSSAKPSSGFFGQVLGTIDDFYSHDAPAEKQESPTANHDPQTGKPHPQPSEETSVKKETEALVRDTLAQAKPQETEASQGGRASSRASQPPQGQPMVSSQAAVSQPATAQRSSAPRWARGGLLGSLFGEEDSPEDQPPVQIAPQPTQQAASPPTRQPTQTESTHSQGPTEADGLLAKPAGAAARWMNKLVDPLFGKDEPTERLASTPPATRQASTPPAARPANASPTTRQASMPPTTRQVSTPPVTRPTRRLPIAHPEVNRPMAQARTPAARPAQRGYSMAPTVAIQFGQKVEQSAPSHPQQAEMQLAETAPPSSRQVARTAPLTKSSEKVLTLPSATADDITPIVEDRVATSPVPTTAAAGSVLAAPPVDLADVLPKVAAAASRVAVVPAAERTPTLAEEYARTEIRLTDPPTTVVPLQPSEIAGIEFASSVDALGLAELTGQGRQLNPTKPSTEGRPVRNAPAIEVARQPQLVR